MPEKVVKLIEKAESSTGNSVIGTLRFQEQNPPAGQAPWNVTVQGPVQELSVGASYLVAITEPVPT